MGGRMTRLVTPSARSTRDTTTTTTSGIDQADFEMFELDALPDDILENVLSFIPGKPLLVYRRVCTRWRDIIDRQLLWRTKCERENVIRDSWYRHVVSRVAEPMNFRRLYFDRPYTRNLIKNPCAIDTLKFWKVKARGGDGFRCESDHPGSNPITQYAPVAEPVPCWATSYGRCEKSQLVDLVAEGCSQSVLDNLSPAIHISEWYSARFDCGGKYSLNVKLLSADRSVIDTFDFSIDIPVRRVWHQVSHTFRDYGVGVRFVKFTHSGVDTSFWAGFYGPKFTMATVKFVFP